MNEQHAGWWPQLNKEQKLIFVVACLAWLFDCLDQSLFNLARAPAMASLLRPDQIPNSKFFAGLATTFFVLGWATGGMIFGSMGDKFGRAKMLGLCVLMYSITTGLTAFSKHFADFAAYLFVTGLSIGGVFGLAVALIADSLPDSARPRALGALQTFSAVGNISAGLIGLGVSQMKVGPGYWKWLFVIGALPALLTAIIQWRLKEPQRWVEARAKAGKKAGSYRELFGHPTWRKHALIGMLLCCAGVIGLWGIGVFSNDMVGDVVTMTYTKLGLPAAAIGAKKQMWVAINLIGFNVGAYFGLLVFTRATVRWGRKKAFATASLAALIVTNFVFRSLRSTTDILWMAPMLGFAQLSVFAGYSIYLPELFPTRLRSTGTSYCYNVGRYLAATGPFTLGTLAMHLARNAGTEINAKIDAFRNATSLMSVVFLLGIVVLPFLPETKDKPLPEG